MSLRITPLAPTDMASAERKQLSQLGDDDTKVRRENSKIEKAGKDFESILLGNWLQQAENSFAKVPGGDGQDDDEDAGKDQFQGLAMQSLATSLTASGGIGIAKMITKHLLASTEHAAENSVRAANHANHAPPDTSTK